MYAARLHKSWRCGRSELSLHHEDNDKRRRSLRTNPYGKPRGPCEAWDWHRGCSSGWHSWAAFVVNELTLHKLDLHGVEPAASRLAVVPSGGAAEDLQLRLSQRIAV